MSKTGKIIIGIIGVLTLLSSLNTAREGGEFLDYFSGIFLGVSLMGAAFFLKEETAE